MNVKYVLREEIPKYKRNAKAVIETAVVFT